MRCCLLAAALCLSALAQPPVDPASGRQIFESQCALCHGQTGGGGRGPSLTRPTLGRAPDDKALRELISQGVNDMPGAWQLHEDEVAAVASYVRTLGALPPEEVPGDATRGARIYATAGCAACHMVDGTGAGFGPELSAIGARRSAAHLRRTVLTPSATIPDGFLYISAVPSSGPALRGIRLNEDSFTIQLRDAAGAHHSLRKSQLKELRRLEGETPMPPYQGKIPAADLDDLVAYLAARKGKP